MTAASFLGYLTAIAAGFFSGSIMFCQIIPKVLTGKDIQAISEDHNPGATNVFVNCGAGLGLFCLALDLLKGFLPILFSCLYLDTHNLLFGIVLASPVLGHAIAPFDHFHGGKCIATSFGEMLGLMHFHRIGLLLAFLYIFFSVVIKIHPNRVKSLVVFGLFGLISSVILTSEGEYGISLGCMLISLIAIIKHSKYFMR